VILNNYSFLVIFNNYSFLVILNNYSFLVILNNYSFLVILNNYSFLVILNNHSFLVILNNYSFLVILNNYSFRVPGDPQQLPNTTISDLFRLTLSHIRNNRSVNRRDVSIVQYTYLERIMWREQAQTRFVLPIVEFIA